MSTKKQGEDPSIDTKTQALNAARSLLQLKGFNGFSFQDIADDLGIRKASLHYHFSSKEELGLALIEDFKNAFLQWIPHHEDLPATQKLEKYSQIFQKMSQDSLKICPTGVYCSDFNTLPGKMQKALREFHNVQKEWMEKTITQGKREKSLRKDLNVTDTALLVLSTIQGSLQLGRMDDNTKVVKQCSSALFSLLKA